MTISQIATTTFLRPGFTLCVLLTLLICRAGNAADLSKIPALSPESGRTYHLHVGDTLDIKFFYDPELDQQVCVRPDGRISLPLAPDIQAEGLTPGELASSLRAHYLHELKDPDVSVLVRSYSPQKVFISGEVLRPGAVDLSGVKTLLQAVSEAGGFKDSARLNEVLLIRQNANGQIVTLKLDVSSTLKGKANAEDHVLEASDIVYVPRSHIANVNYWVDAYIRKNIPGSIGMMTIP
ncbi:MAG TPA: polysaccharide biosynthesis/export family protein [Bryobacteraceae bacterium]|nr:polysaccharide biosynthesis/export family protein [Bryobacteraceae bacterium]